MSGFFVGLRKATFVKGKFGQKLGMLLALLQIRQVLLQEKGSLAFLERKHTMTLHKELNIIISKENNR